MSEDRADLDSCVRQPENDLDSFADPAMDSVAQTPPGGYTSSTLFAFQEAKVASELTGNEFMAGVGTIKELNVSPEYSRTGKLGPENPTEAVLILQHAFSGTNVPFEVALKATDEKLSPLLSRLHGLFLDARLTSRSVRITYEQNPERAQQVIIQVTL